MSDILNIAQPEAQERRRADMLDYMKRTGAPDKAIRTMEKDLQLTRRRLERARAAEGKKEE